ncbi:hypothetical protein KC19_9G045300 [Ceratodon purpureus]|uniref:Uncharacterized protein n=1 Tax=Ceratodon purpureus TaxID=3225 RepID=A0A8T0GRJ2_CERPU|nr:hypothetical protein KC19_9G045300 [Ceratodon purpureus]
MPTHIQDIDNFLSFSKAFRKLQTRRIKTPRTKLQKAQLLLTDLKRSGYSETKSTKKHSEEATQIQISGTKIRLYSYRQPAPGPISVPLISSTSSKRPEYKSER